MQQCIKITICAAICSCLIPSCSTRQATPATAEVIDGMLLVEAESFSEQKRDSERRWYVTPDSHSPGIGPDGDGNHAGSASGHAYLEILPDTRRSHADSLIPGLNFSDEPGAVAVISYPIRFREAGRYHVWVSAYSTGTEDNGIHVGIDGTWPESGQRMQWCEGKHTWRWESRQRTEINHCGEPGKIYLDVSEPGLHVVQFSMREDGFEFDRFLLTTDSSHVFPLSR
jgi:hypothetical protein